jgi:uncharacterized protein
MDDASTHAPARPSLDQPLSEADYDRLEEILSRFPQEDAMDLEEMDGFFAALVCAPQMVPPSAYLHQIWGGGEPPFSGIGDFEAFLNLAMRHWNTVSKKLADPDHVFMPLLLTEEGEEFPSGNSWAEGFLAGVALSGEGWDELFGNEDKFFLLLPVLVLAHEHDPDPEMRTWKTPPSAERRKELIATLCMTTQGIHEYFRSQRVREARHMRGGTRKSERKIGRNDPCYCGSGKKYKHCCGNATVN